MKRDITVLNPTRRRRWGYGISTTPSGYGTSIRPPRGPRYTGSFASIARQMEADRPYLGSVRSCFSCDGWFWRGRGILCFWDENWGRWTTDVPPEIKYPVLRDDGDGRWASVRILIDDEPD